jgi:hypothetical protein
LGSLEDGVKKCLRRECRASGKLDMSFPESILKVFNFFRENESPVVAGVDADGAPRPLKTDSSGSLSVETGLAPSPGTYDNIVLDPPSQPTTITYKLGSTTVATLTLTYSGSDIATITRS